MKKKLSFSILLCSLILCSSDLWAQHIKPKLPADQIVGSYYPTKGEPIMPTFINPLLDKDNPDWSISITQKGGIYHSAENQSEKERIKAEKLLLKRSVQNTRLDMQANSRNNPVPNPVVNTSFEANAFDGWLPSDNDMAISDNGYIVSVINSAVSYYDQDGNVLLANQSFGGLLTSLNVSNFLFDPRVLYDPVEDRFIMVVLSGNDSETSNVVVGFSVSENPADGWHFYSLRDDFLNGGWFDYPNIGISDSDFYVSGNLFGGASGVTLLQIKKSDGYDGADLTYEFFNDINISNGNSAFTLVPASYGFDGNYGPGIFMVSSSFFGNNGLSFFEVTDSVNAEQQINVYNIPVSNYSIAGNALQYSTDVLLDTGDTRIEDSFYSDSTVHLVFTTDVSNGYAGIRYTRINLPSLTSENLDISRAMTDYAYPSVKPFSKSDTSKKVLIGFLESSSLILPTISAIVVDDDLEMSDPLIIKVGETIIDGNSGQAQRWGDYSGSSVRHNEEHPTVWIVGCTGKNGDYGNWIAEVSEQPNGEAPIINFEGNPRRGEVSHTVRFTDRSQNGATFWSWTFPGGSPGSSNERSPFVRYHTPGLYDVQLIVANDAGTDTFYREDYIRAIVLPTSDFVADVTEGSAPLTVNYTQLSQFGESYIWFFSGGSPPIFNGEFPEVTYNSPGSYNVQLTTLNPNGSAVELKPNYITVGAVATDDLENSIEKVNVYPNPSNNRFKVEFFIKERKRLDVHLADANGKIVKQIINDNLKAGYNEIAFSTDPLASGVYFMIIQDHEKNIIKHEKIIIAR